MAGSMVFGRNRTQGMSQKLKNNRKKTKNLKDLRFYI